MKKQFRKLTGLLIAVAGLSIVPVVLAQSGPTGMTNPGGPFTANPSPKGYVDLSAGQTDYRLGNGTGLFGHDNRSTAYTLSGGAYFTNNLGVEFGYTDFGRINRGGGSTRAEGLSLRLVGKLPVAQSFNLLGKIGTTYGRTDVSSAPGSGIAAGSDSGFGLSAGLGAELVFTPNWSGLLQYDIHDLRFAGGVNDRDRLAVLSLGLRYSF
jgi:opacity protein-like surface antigen